MTTKSGAVQGVEIATGREIPEGDGYASNGHDLVFKSTGEELHYIGKDGVEVSSGVETGLVQNRQIGSKQADETIMRIVEHPSESILAVGYLQSVHSPNGSPSVQNNGDIRLYNSETGDELVSLDVPKGATSALAFSPDGTLLASGGTYGTVRLWGVPAAGS